jgi:hypothetical protein
LPVLLGLKEFSTRLKSLDQVLNQLYVMEKQDIPGYWNEQSKMAVFVREILDPVQRSDICRRICPKK